MLVDIDFDELQGYEVVGVATVEKVIEELVKLDNGDKFEFDFDVESEVAEYDDVLIFKQVHSVARLQEHIDFLRKSALPDEMKDSSIRSSEEFIEKLQNLGGTFETYKMVINDTVYDASMR